MFGQKETFGSVTGILLHETDLCRRGRGVSYSVIEVDVHVVSCFVVCSVFWLVR
jgi:hypothetical protein